MLVCFAYLLFVLLMLIGYGVTYRCLFWFMVVLCFKFVVWFACVICLGLAV